MPTVDRYLARHVLTQDADGRWLSPGVVDVVDGRIDTVGSPQDVPDRPGARVHRLSGMLLPGFVNAHAHSPMVLLRGAGDGLPVARWSAEAVWPREGRLSPDDIAWGMRLGAAEHRDDPLIQGVIGPHAAYTVPEAPLREAGRIAAAEGLLLHLHVAESEHEDDVIRERYGVSVPRYLEQLGVLETRVRAAHGVWLDDDYIAIFAEHDVAVAHCPDSNGNHASGLAPVTALRAAGIPVAIATDGPASHDRLDVFDEMRAAIRLARLRERNASVLGPDEALRMVTTDAARAIGRNDLGVIEAGRRADLVLIDTDPLRPVVERSDLLTHLVRSGSPALVRSVWVDGRRVVSDGEVTTIDVPRAAAEVTSRAVRIAGTWSGT